jgi:DNA-binding IclR family transcriptional regulator
MGPPGILTPIAAAIIRSLNDHPERRTPEDIAEGAGLPDADRVRGGLADLESRGLVERHPDGGWRSTDAGREA